ncbi:Hydroxyethylthiazole kinase [Arcticibacter svalbardensis MN12-7]|uniref:Hydroxyethylthiazole kinase n=1 Tax=Arcticibacter svalbardensis MN12-7 TaxID=1150600 RepID=R9GPU4_9SPHI|nr:hydroxyethylthiazole kinase [Arcticibacter svalbardensis]EOR93713.1 Hydroxyethylthiazole kinase [Arcticibacter svalbardensis MN12-7]
MEKSLWKSILSVRTDAPLIHNITNYVVMNNTANALLAIGASPIMAHAHPEVEEMVNISNALVINIGTLDEYWCESMDRAAKKANELHKSWILDPVGAGATLFRDQTVINLINYKPTVIRGNASEIMAIAKVSRLHTKGVDSVYQSEEAIEAAQWLNSSTGSIICVSGAVDVIISRKQKAFIRNGHPMMQQVTGLGCTATAIIAAFLGNDASDPFHATVSAMCLLGIAGEIAQKNSNGPGSLQMNLLDKLYNLTEQEFSSYLKIDFQND